MSQVFNISDSSGNSDDSCNSDTENAFAVYSPRSLSLSPKKKKTKYSQDEPGNEAGTSNQTEQETPVINYDSSGSVDHSEFINNDEINIKILKVNKGFNLGSNVKVANIRKENESQEVPEAIGETMNFFKKKLPYLPKKKFHGSEIEWNEISIKDDTANFLFTICNFSHLCKKNGEFVQSSKFGLKKNKNMNWYLRLFPKGCNKKQKNFISLFLHRDFEDPLEVKVNYFIAILDKNKNDIELKGNNIVFKQNDGWGSPELIELNELIERKETLLPDDTLTIFCTISTSIIVETKSKTVQLKNATDKLGINKRLKLDTELASNEIYEKCFADNTFSDITLYVQNKELKAHKVFLSAASPVFASILKKDTVSITVADISYEVMQQMLLFIYTKKVDDINSIAHELIVAADKYGIKALKNKCELSLGERISMDNVLKIIVIADENCANILKKIAIEFIIKNKSVLIENPDFKKIFEIRPHLYELIFWSEVESV